MRVLNNVFSPPKTPHSSSPGYTFVRRSLPVPQFHSNLLILSPFFLIDPFCICLCGIFFSAFFGGEKKKVLRNTSANIADNCLNCWLSIWKRTTFLLDEVDKLVMRKWFDPDFDGLLVPFTCRMQATLLWMPMNSCSYCFTKRLNIICMFEGGLDAAVDAAAIATAGSVPKWICMLTLYCWKYLISKWLIWIVRFSPFIVRLGAKTRNNWMAFLFFSKLSIGVMAETCAAVVLTVSFVHLFAVQLTSSSILV